MKKLLFPGTNDGGRKRGLTGVLVITILTLSTLVGFALAVSPARATGYPEFTLTLNPYGNLQPPYVGLAAWQKSYAYSTTVYTSEHSSDSAQMAIKFQPISYYIDTWGYFTLHFGLNVRSAVNTGDNLYGGSSLPFYYSLPTGNYPSVISYVQITGTLMPLGYNALGQPISLQHRSNDLVFEGAGSNTLQGYYSSSSEYLWHTTGEYQTSDDYNTWVNQATQRGAELSVIKKTADAIDAVTSVAGYFKNLGYLSYVGGGVSYLLNTIYAKETAIPQHQAYGNMPSQYSVSFTQMYNPETASSYVTQSNNWFSFLYRGYLKDYVNNSLSSVTLRLNIDDRLVTYSGSWSGADHLGAALNIVLTKSGWNPGNLDPVTGIYKDSTNPQPVEDIGGSAYNDGYAKLSWRCDYYKADDDWVRYYKVVDNAGHTWWLENTLNGANHFQNNVLDRIYQDYGVTRTYTVSTVDASGRQGTGVSCSVYTPDEEDGGDGDGHGACPNLFVWGERIDGTQQRGGGIGFVDEGVLRIHNESDPYTDIVLMPILMLSKPIPVLDEDRGLVYLMKLSEIAAGYNFSHSYIDQVRFYAVGNDGKWYSCRLVWANHSVYGEVTRELRHSDNIYAETFKGQEIALEFKVPYINCGVQCFVFVVEGHNPLKM